MAKQRTRKKKKPEKEKYEIEVEDWEVAYRFELNTAPKDLVEGVFWLSFRAIARNLLQLDVFSPVLDFSLRSK